MASRLTQVRPALQPRRSAPPCPDQADTHTVADDFADILGRARRAGVGMQLLTGDCLEGSKEVLALAQQHGASALSFLLPHPHRSRTLMCTLPTAQRACTRPSAATPVERPSQTRSPAARRPTLTRSTSSSSTARARAGPSSSASAASTTTASTWRPRRLSSSASRCSLLARSAACLPHDQLY